MDTIGFLGSGNMAEALIRGVIYANVYRPENISISDIRTERLKFLADKYSVIPFESNAELAEKVDILVLSVKPQNMAEALQSVKDVVRDDLLVITIAAGIKIADITSVLGDIAIVRVMPNTPVLIDEGASAVFANEKAKPMLEKVRLIFLSVGRDVVVDDEDLIDVVTAVSGSGPAYFFLLMDEMIKAGVEMGLSEDLARGLVLQTAKGAALLAEQARKNGETPAQLGKKVATAGGTTEAAFNVFAEKNFNGIVLSALQRAAERSRELSRESGIIH